MGMYRGPCLTCGKHVERYLTPRQKKRCLECGIQAHIDHNRALAARRHPDMAKSYRAGEDMRRQIEARSGPLYERWIAGQLAAISRYAADEEADTG